MEELKSLRKIPPTEGSPGDEHTTKHDGLHIDVYRLIHLTRETAAQEVAIRNFSQQLGDFCWTDVYGRISPEFVIHLLKDEGYEKTAKRCPSLMEHIDKIRDADYSFPLISYRGWIVDGMHRIAKAAIENQTTVRVKNLEEIPQEALIAEKS